MSDSMLERVARAICTENGGAPNNLQDFGGIWHRQWEAYIVHAKAAINAMREPNYSMLLEADFRRIPPTEASRTWRTMIDAALNEGSSE